MIIAKALRLNAQIRISPIRVIDQDQRQLGIVPLKEALDLARNAGLDLVEVSPTERPPVCRIMDYGKFKYDRKKRQKQASHGHVISIKEIRIRPKTDAHDRSIKMERAKRFLDEGHKVQFTMLFRGRERFHKDRAIDIFDAILLEFGETVKVERRPMMEGRRMTMVIAPVKRVAPQPAQPAHPARPAQAAQATTPDRPPQAEERKPPAPPAVRDNVTPRA